MAANWGSEACEPVGERRGSRPLLAALARALTVESVVLLKDAPQGFASHRERRRHFQAVNNSAAKLGIALFFNDDVSVVTQAYVTFVFGASTSGEACGSPELHPGWLRGRVRLTGCGNKGRPRDSAYHRDRGPDLGRFRGARGFLFLSRCHSREQSGFGGGISTRGGGSGHVTDFGTSHTTVCGRRSPPPNSDHRLTLNFNADDLISQVAAVRGPYHCGAPGPLSDVYSVARVRGCHRGHVPVRVGDWGSWAVVLVGDHPMSAANIFVPGVQAAMTLVAMNIISGILVNDAVEMAQNVPMSCGECRCVAMNLWYCSGSLHRRVKNIELRRASGSVEESSGECLLQDSRRR